MKNKFFLLLLVIVALLLEALAIYSLLSKHTNEIPTNMVAQGDSVREQ